MEEALLHAGGGINVCVNSQESGSDDTGKRPTVKTVNLFTDLSVWKDCAYWTFVGHQTHPRFFLPEESMLNKYHVPLAGLFWFRAPQHVPAIFPKSALKLDVPLIPLALNGKYWAKVDIQLLESFEDIDNNWGMINLPAPDWKRFRWCDKTNSSVKWHGHHSDRSHGVPLSPASPASSPDDSLSLGCKTVLYMCFHLLRSPDDTQRWLEKTENLRFRRLALEQLREVDKWLVNNYNDSEGDILNYHVSRISSTTMLLSEAAEATNQGILERSRRPRQQGRSSSPNPTSYSTTQTMGNLEDHTESRKKGWLPATIVDYSSGTLEAIRKLLDGLNLSNSTLSFSFQKSWDAAPKGTRNMFKVLSQKNHKYPGVISTYDQHGTVASEEGEISNFLMNLGRFDYQLQALLGTEYNAPENIFNTHRALDALGDILVYHLEKGDSGSWWDRHIGWKDNEDGRELDDVIIYRCLIVTLLFRTTLDSSEILKSGLWEQIVPII